MAASDSIDLVRFPHIKLVRANELYRHYFGFVDDLIAARLITRSMIPKPPKQTKRGQHYFVKRRSGGLEARLFHDDPASYKATKLEALQTVMTSAPYFYMGHIGCTYYGTPGELMRAGVADEAMFVFKSGGRMTDEFGCGIYVIRRTEWEWEIHRTIGDDFMPPKSSKVRGRLPEPWDPMPRILEIRDRGIA